MKKEDLTELVAGERFRFLIESVSDYAIFMLDPHGHISTWNIGAERIKGYRAEEILGKHFSVFYPAEDVQAGKCELELEGALRDGRWEDEGWRLRKDGSRFWANVVISAVKDERGTHLGFAKVTRDLTERRRAQEEQAARLAAEKANRAKDEFLAMLGHELRNPLAPIVTALQLMKLRGDHRSTKEQQVIERQVKHMMHLVDDLLDVSRITRGTIDLERRNLDVRDAVAKAIEIVSPLVERRGHHLEVQVPDSPTIVHADEARLTQVFANLLNNAAKYTDPGGHIDVVVELSGLEVSVEIRDDGVGIPPELLPNVFNLFVQGSQSVARSAGGLGIGLTVVRTLVERHDGHVSVHSEGIGKGSAFTVRLPLAEGPLPEAEESVPSPILLRKALHPRRILIVDDNDDALGLLADVLSAVGHEVRTATDAVAALTVAARFKPEVALLDIGLPVMDGYELAARLRATVGPPPPRLIALTGYGQPRDRARTHEAGFDEHLVKPVGLERLLDCIEASK